MHSVIDSQDFPTTGSCCRRVVSCVHFTIAIWLSQFDASSYVLWPYLYCCWRLVLFWALFVAFWWWFVGGGILQCIVIVWSFLRLLKLCKLAVCKLTLEYPFNRRFYFVETNGILSYGSILFCSGRVACLFHTGSASPWLPVLHALLYETHETSVHTGTL